MNIGYFLQVVADSPTLKYGDTSGGWTRWSPKIPYNPNYSVVEGVLWVDGNLKNTLQTL